MGSEGKELHVFVFPLMAPGHLLPAVDIAKLLAIEGARVSVITTAGNAAAVRASTHRLIESGHRLDTLLVEFSPSDLDLPDDMSLVKSADKHVDFLLRTSALRPSFQRLVNLHRPSAIISDMFYTWTVEIAEEFQIPRLVFHGSNLFSLCVEDQLKQRREDLNSNNIDRILIPELPHSIELRKSQLPDKKKMRPEFADLFITMEEAEKKSYGAVMNSFYELEPEYVNHYRKVMGKKAWHIGPVFLRSDMLTDLALRGVREDDNGSRILNWLDSKAPRSVLYVCFGSLSRFTRAQVEEIAAGLESSGCCFLWVTRSSEGFRESGKGIIVGGWVPQVMVLNHWAVGGFMTHCGWNSSLEAVAAGLPVVTWPMFADQFLNERFLVEVLRIGVEIGVKSYAIEEEEMDFVRGERVREAVGRVMGDGGEAEERRRRARELRAAARRAVEEGGSSRKDIRRLVEELSSMDGITGMRGMEI